MNFLTMLQNFILYPIQQLMNLLKSKEISDFLFNGDVTYLEVIIAFFVGAILIKFLLAPVRLSYRDNSTSPVTEVKSNPDPHASKTDPWGIKMR